MSIPNNSASAYLLTTQSLKQGKTAPLSGRRCFSRGCFTSPMQTTTHVGLAVTLPSKPQLSRPGPISPRSGEPEVGPSNTGDVTSTVDEDVGTQGLWDSHVCQVHRKENAVLPKERHKESRGHVALKRTQSKLSTRGRGSSPSSSHGLVISSFSSGVSLKSYVLITCPVKAGKLRTI